MDKNRTGNKNHRKQRSGAPTPHPQAWGISGPLGGSAEIFRVGEMKLKLVNGALKEKVMIEAGCLGAAWLKFLSPGCSETTSEPAMCPPLLTPCLLYTT